MAKLPYTATLVAPPRRTLTHIQEFEQVQEWCLQMWPYTHGATWYRGYIQPTLIGRGYICTWSFQFREDLTMFLLTWGHLVESSPAMQKES